MLNAYEDPLRLTADPSRVVVRPFHLPSQSHGAEPGRAQRLVQAVLGMSGAEVRKQLNNVLSDFEARHWQTRRVFMSRYEQIVELLQLNLDDIGDEKRQLIGAYFCHEYSYAAAALMNPSVIPHPDQSGLDSNSVRILISLRAVGEGHISSIAFREGLIAGNRELILAPNPPFATATYTSDLAAEGRDGPVTIHRHADSTLSGTVIFPITPAQRNGLEDLRLTQFTHDDGHKEYIGTYTAYSGREIQSELMRTTDFRDIDLVPMRGSAARNKGMALFPRKVGGRYMMIGRQDGQNLFLIDSDDVGHWEEGSLLLRPVFPWEFVQIGNCGPPIELDEGWLLLTHGVGAMRKYAIGAVLLDKKDPSKVIGRAREPILAAQKQDREGYVPNVVYTCGALKHGDQLFMPYGIADSSVAFAFVPLKEMLNLMQ